MDVFSAAGAASSNNTLYGYSDSYVENDEYVQGATPSALSYNPGSNAHFYFKNNLIVDTLSRTFSGDIAPTEYSNNVWYSTAETPKPIPEWDSSALNVNPILSNAYAPLAGSPLLAAGIPLSGITHDLRGNVRPAVPAIGALELENKANRKNNFPTSIFMLFME